MPRISKFIERYENAPLGFGLWLSSALFIIFVRDGIECLISTGSFAVPDGFHLIHVPVFFLSLLLFIIILLHLFSASEIGKVSKIALVFFPVIILPVVLDFIVTCFTGAQITYHYIAGDIATSLFRFFDPTYKIPEVPSSLRLEIGLLMLLSFGYIFLKRKKVLPAALGALCVVLACYFYGAIPAILLAILKALASLLASLRLENFPFSEGVVDESLITLVELALTVLFAFIWLFRYNPAQGQAVINKVRLARFLPNALWCLLGVLFSWINTPLKDFFGLIRIGGILLAVFFASQFLVLRDGRECLNTRAVFLALSLLFAYWVNETCAMIILLFVAFYFFYVAPPMRLERFFPLSGFILGLQAWLIFAAGTYALRPSSAAPLYPPAPILWLIFIIAFSLGFHRKKS